MKTAPRVSGPVLAFGIVGLILISIGAWIGIRRQTNPAPALEPSAPAATAAATVAAEPESTPAPPRRWAEGEIPAVIPVYLGDTLAEPENTAWANDKFWQEVPRGTQTLANVEFILSGIVQLQSAGSIRAKQNYRTNVFIPLSDANLIGDSSLVPELRRTIGCLHLLGGSRYGNDSSGGKKIATLIWHYDDGSSARSDFSYNEHLRDWLRTAYEEPERLPNRGTKVVWRNVNRAAKDRSIRLYRVSLANPAPTKYLTGLEFQTTSANPNLFFVGLTLDPLGVGERPDATPDLEEIDPAPAATLDVSVQNEEYYALSGVTVKASYSTDNPKGDSTKKIARISRTLKTDASGVVRFKFADAAPTSLELQATMDEQDYEGRKIAWDTKSGAPVPANYTFKLKRGISFGGTVVDEANQPIADAKLNFYRYWMGDDDMNAKGEKSEFSSRTVTTDAQGAWRLKGIPAGIIERIGFGVTHPDFVATNFQLNGESNLESSLRNGKHIIQLRRGLVVRGIVTDENNTPVKDATVSAGRQYSPGSQQSTTDAQGSFNFRGVPEGKQVFSVVAKNFRPITTNVLIQAGMNELQFRLGPGLLIRGIVKDEAGEPIPNVRITMERDYGGTSQDFDFSMNSDAQGIFEWNGAPEAEVNFGFTKQGYETKNRQALKAGEENIVKMRKGRELQAIVVDAETEKPITTFRAGAGRLYNMGSEHENFYPDSPGIKDYSDPNGKFTLTLSNEETSGIKVEADDYAPKTEKLPEPQNGVIEITLRLKPSASINGVLVNTQGQPVSGASVALTKENSFGNELRITKGKLASYSNASKIVTTDENGKFKLGSPPDSGGVIIASAESGFARASVDEVRNTGRLMLQDLGKIEGTYRVAGSPQAGAEFMFSLMNIGLQTDFQTARTKTDSEGKFTFDKIPPGEGQIVRLVKMSENSWLHSRTTPVTVEPGIVTRVNFGDEGAVIKGQARMESDPGTDQQVTLSGNLSATSIAPSHNFASPEEATAFYQSAEGKKERQAQQARFFGVSINADGTFAIDSIPPGDYTLTISANIPGKKSWEQKQIATGSTTINVPENASPYAPIGISDIILKSVKN